VKFFDQGGNRINCQEWLATYEPYYFLDGPKLGRSIGEKNQTSHFVEAKICALLEQGTSLFEQDLILAMAWKTGQIDHRSSESQKKMIFAGNWATSLTTSGQYTLNFSASIPFVAARLATITAEINQGNPPYFFDLSGRLDGFGKVHRLTVTFFVSHGKFPIYDKYADVGAAAIDGDVPPGRNFPYKQLTKWREYELFMDRLARIKHCCPQERTSSPMFVSRSFDRSLWSYGHFFKIDSGSRCV
jgi:hypothetical protein